jgi:hypothetical protein
LVYYSENLISSEKIGTSGYEVIIVEGTYILEIEEFDFKIFIDRNYRDTHENRMKRNRDEQSDFVEKVLKPNKFDTSYSTWPSEKISDTLALYFSTKGQRIEEKDWPKNLPAHKGNQCFIIPSRQDKTKVYYACIGTGQTVAIIVPYRVTDGKVLTGDEAKPLLKESVDEMEAFSKNAFNYVKRQIPRKDYQLKTFSSGTPNKSLVNVLMVLQNGVSKGTAVQHNVQMRDYAGVFTCVDSSGDEDMAIPSTYRNKKKVELDNNVIFMDTERNRPKALEWMNNNPKVLFVENPDDPLPEELQHPHKPKTLVQGIQATLQLIGIPYKG